MKKAIAPARTTWLLAALSRAGRSCRGLRAGGPRGRMLPPPTPRRLEHAAGAAVVNSLGKEMPADAAPLDQQVLVYPCTAARITYRRRFL